MVEDILRVIWSKYNTQTKEQKSEMVRLIKKGLVNADKGYEEAEDIQVPERR